MKTTIAILLGLGLATSAFAQGTFVFVNSGATAVKYEVAPSVFSNAPVNLTSVEFVWAELETPVSTYTGGLLSDWLTANPGWTALSASIKALSPVAGRFNAGAQTALTSVPGATIQAFVIGWYVPSGPQGSFDAAYLTPGLVQVGFSSLFQIDTGNPFALPVPEPPTALVGSSSGYSGLQLHVVPEPGVVSLAGLAAAALFVFRRRR